MDILSNWQNPHIGFLTYERKIIIIEKAKWKPLILPSPSLEDCKIKNNTALVGTAEISTILKDINDEGLKVPIFFCFVLFVLNIFIRV